MARGAMLTGDNSAELADSFEWIRADTLTVEEVNEAEFPAKGGKGINPVTLKAQVLLDRRAVRPYHNQEVLGFERCGCVHRVSDKASSADLMQDLGLRGLHPGARPCRQDDERRQTISPHAPAP